MHRFHCCPQLWARLGVTMDTRKEESRVSPRTVFMVPSSEIQVSQLRCAKGISLPVSGNSGTDIHAFFDAQARSL